MARCFRLASSSMTGIPNSALRVAMCFAPVASNPIQPRSRSPNLNAFAERFVRSIKDECLSKLILFGGTFAEAGHR